MLIEYRKPIRLIGAAAVGGSMELSGPLGEYLDLAYTDDLFDADSWESAEANMVRYAIERALYKLSFRPNDVDLLLAGDLLNQCTASSYCAADFGIPYCGLYNACATFALGCLIAGLSIESGAIRRAIALSGSHFSGAERQYRFPLEYGCQRTPTAQRTVTACGCAVFSDRDPVEAAPIYLTRAMPGTIVDFGIKDTANMGAAMAPAAAKTLIDYLNATGTTPGDYDRILTGDLGWIGAGHFKELCAQNGVVLDHNYLDCGTQIYKKDQDVHSGASGSGCSAFYLCGYLEKVWRKTPFARVLLIGTGALMSPLTIQQKQSIPAIAHAVEFGKEPII